MSASSERPSLTHGGKPVDFYWIGETSDIESEHVEAAIEALVKAADGDDLRLSSNPHLLALAKAAFKTYLSRLMKGVLQPIDQVRSLARPSACLFEVRWQSIRVRVCAKDGGYEHKDILVRMIFAEPPELGDAALGLHAHEKIVVEDDERQTRLYQNEEIDHAALLYERGEANRWGVTLRN